ncbi:MAG: hypothetical protein Q8N10_03505 [Phenylobacterium sp.]|uniref:hypothetical protein n=1 Tax=Phenylobacterium sp. TaxID=1871053 RepID=UPI00271CFC1B|nr:hypothetical protein [Phenylobacterium sp.]MDO8912337.1 hypothetical protein [Phenylobacterium sp.]MDP3099549.1 hypothetical protein [Phenylobacterium sp.]
MIAPPIPTRWDGEAFVPLPRFAGLADEHYVVGQVYTMAEIQARSHKTHAHYFARVNDIWATLPDPLAARFKSADALRKYALISTGHCDESSTVCMFKTEAQRLAASMRPLDEFSVVTVNGKVVTRYTAKSMDIKSMDKEAFQKAKEDTLRFLEDLIGVAPAELARAA